MFARSRIELLPHQMWVCKRVNEQWPMRWLVADDVGLGKTIEAGLVLSPLIVSGRVRRLLILCPASLVEQWQYRLRTMFDIRLARYLPEADTPRVDFWGTHNQVAVSLQTLRDDRKGRHDRLFESQPWDLLIVDEAHHLNADENSGPTLGYRLVDRMVQERLVDSMIFFTGTPHRGKDFGFFSLLHLLRPDLFDPRASASSQLSSLESVMIRNNKQDVTDLNGRRLFRPPRVSSENYTFTEAEARFYVMLTDFIVAGKAYASSLDATNGRAVVLVLIAMQKLASSSVAAVRRALRRRLQRIVQARQELAKLEAQMTAIEARNARNAYESTEGQEDLDRLGQLEEQIIELSTDLRLMQDEEPRLKELIEAAEAIGSETKIDRLLDVLNQQLQGESVLLFTEYKATQSLVMSALMKRFGEDSVGFINGDERADEVQDAAGNLRSLKESREQAAERFNAGTIQFLVSTEAGGEGIDLQVNCHTLIHVDLPWNPMRMHQRVGRLNRYGQSRQVQVVLLRNPQTVESLIWEKLNEKLEAINRALSQVMDEPEDLLDLVLGMTSPSLFREVFSEAHLVPRDSLSRWFDLKTASFGGQDAIDTVRQLVGNCARFDFKEVSDRIPRLDLPDLASFVKNMLFLNGRKYISDEDGLSFKTPDSWRTEIGVRSNYNGLIFERNPSSADSIHDVVGIGHRVFDQALDQALRSTGSVALIPHGLRPIFAFSIADRITGSGGTLRHAAIGWEGAPGTTGSGLLLDWQLLRRLNELSGTAGLRRPGEPGEGRIPTSEVVRALRQATVAVEQLVANLDLPFSMPTVIPLAVLWPRSGR